MRCHPAAHGFLNEEMKMGFALMKKAVSRYLRAPCP